MYLEFRSRLQSLPRTSQLAFAALCMERIIAAGTSFVDANAIDLVRRVTNAAWGSLAGRECNPAELKSWHKQLDSLCVQAKGPDWTEGDPEQDPVLYLVCSVATLPLTTMRWPERVHAVESVYATYLHLLDIIADQHDLPLDDKLLDTEQQWCIDILDWLSKIILK